MHVNVTQFYVLIFEFYEGVYIGWQCDSDVISMPAGFRRHFVGKPLINVFHCDIAEKRFVGKLVIIQTFQKPTDWMLIK